MAFKILAVNYAIYYVAMILNLRAWQTETSMCFN